MSELLYKTLRESVVNAIRTKIMKRQYTFAKWKNTERYDSENGKYFGVYETYSN